MEEGRRKKEEVRRKKEEGSTTGFILNEVEEFRINPVVGFSAPLRLGTRKQEECLYNKLFTHLYFMLDSAKLNNICSSTTTRPCLC
ncbi:hypothetical protein CP500_001620 [Tychonema bourrellyi FEM_GT703]|uniref:Uncharacterized protein n=1 Tax=Tychonema bourrellyi FEM_GT703 TaxID=2040638 RepID=A0A2G4F5R6_9CYAN|nr:hypothetical protein CP500_001620 [Tychonema bourrellyi FEM_GT703]